jgi:hypothetical protein
MNNTHESTCLWDFLVSKQPRLDLNAVKASGCDLYEIAKAAGSFINKLGRNPDVYKSGSAGEREAHRIIARAEEVIGQVVPMLSAEQVNELVTKAAESIRPGISFTGGSRSVDTAALGFPKGSRARGDRG